MEGFQKVQATDSAKLGSAVVPVEPEAMPRVANQDEVGVTQEQTELLVAEFADHLATMTAAEVQQIAEHLASATANFKDHEVLLFDKLMPQNTTKTPAQEECLQEMKTVCEC